MNKNKKVNIYSFKNENLKTLFYKVVLYTGAIDYWYFTGLIIRSLDQNIWEEKSLKIFG